MKRRQKKDMNDEHIIYNLLSCHKSISYVYLQLFNIKHNFTR